MKLNEVLDLKKDIFATLDKPQVKRFRQGKLDSINLLRDLCNKSNYIWYLVAKTKSRTGNTQEVIIYLTTLDGAMPSLMRVTGTVAEAMGLNLTKDGTLKLTRTLPTDHLAARFSSDICSILFGDANSKTMHPQYL